MQKRPYYNVKALILRCNINAFAIGIYIFCYRYIYVIENQNIPNIQL